MGAYATYSNQPFIARKPLKTKRQRGRIDEIMELISGAHLETNPETGNMQLVRDNTIIGTFTEEETENE